MIYVTGAARSGTTLLAKMLEACGANLGDAGAMAESRSFKTDVLKPYLRRIGVDAAGIDPLPPMGGDFEPIQFTFPGGLLKDPKLCLVWPAMPEGKWVIAYRDPLKVAESCLRTPFLGGRKTLFEWVDWAEAYQARCAMIPNARVVRTQDVIDDPETLAETVEWLGLEFDLKAVKKCIVKKLWRGDVKKDNGDAAS